MTVIRYILVVALLQLAAFCSMGQDYSKIPSAKLKGFAKNAAQVGDAYTAIDYYEAYIAKNPKDHEVAFQLAECYRVSRNYPKAKQWYKKAYDLDQSKEIIALYYFAQMLKTEKNYDTALVCFTKFKKAYDVKKDNRQLKKLVREQITSCTEAKRLLDSLITVTINHLDTTINKPSVEAAPVYLNDKEFLFTSLRSDTPVYVRISQPDMEVPVRQIYKAKKNAKSFKFLGKWSDGSVNAPDINTANGAFSPDKERFYFTRCEKNVKNDVICKIYRTEKKANVWQAATELPSNVNDPKYTSTQPAVGTDSKTLEEVLYFVSDRKEGKGGLDIWYTMYNKKKKTWKNPRNCGSEINTAGDEVSPYIDNDNRTIYFSSNGLPGIGEFDIFRAIGESSKFLPAENIGAPVNSSYDDLFYTMNSTREEGFFVSNRPGGVNPLHETCCDDLYTYNYNQMVKVAATGKVFAIEDENISKLLEDKLDIAEVSSNPSDTGTNKYLAGSIVSLYLIDKVKNDLIYIKNDTTDNEGKFFFGLEPGKEYMLEFENYGNFNKKLKLSTKKVIETDTLVLKAIGVNVMPKQPLIIKNIYYDFDKWDLKPIAKRAIDSTVFKLMRDYPSLVIEICSHTDSKGEDQYNKDLSQKRAESVVKYLIGKGVDSKRLRAKGYGEEKPIAPNEKPDGTDNEVGRERNRRTEFRIIGSLSQYSEIIYEE